jgi:hypothetical protein
MVRDVEPDAEKVPVDQMPSALIDRSAFTTVSVRVMPLSRNAYGTPKQPYF